LVVPLLGLTSPALLYLLAGLLAVLLAGLMWAWPRLARPGLRPVALRIVALCAVQVIMISLIFVVVNNVNGFYSSWADLLGRYRGGGTLITLRGGAPTSTASVSVLAVSRVTGPGGRPGGTLESIRIHGQLSGLAVDAHVYLPPGYPSTRQPGGRYPVIVVISASARARAGSKSPYSAQRTAAVVAGQIASRRIAPVILVTLPPGPGRDQGCLNVPGGPQGAMFFAQDLPAAIGSRYRAGGQPGGWALLGDSSGGYCALQLAMTSTATFSAAAMPASGHYQIPPGLAATGGPQFRRQDDLQWLLRHQPMQPISVLFTGPGQARPFLSLIRSPMRAATARLAAGPAPLVPVLDWLGAALNPGSQG
jgi:enterochelin esterase-like enzyme